MKNLGWEIRELNGGVVRKLIELPSVDDPFVPEDLRLSIRRAAVNSWGRFEDGGKCF